MEGRNRGDYLQTQELVEIGQFKGQGQTGCCFCSSFQGFGIEYSEMRSIPGLMPDVSPPFSSYPLITLPLLFGFSIARPSILHLFSASSSLWRAPPSRGGPRNGGAMDVEP